MRIEGRTAPEAMRERLAEERDATMIECYTTDAHEPMRRTELAFSRNKRAEMNLVKVYPHKTFQRVAGFGAALTESAAYTFALMPPEVQDRFLGLCFGPGGNAYTLCRTHIQSCDFSLGSYAYLTDKRDKGLSLFTIEHDRQLLIPFIQCALAVDPSIEIIASPWSPPAFMKTSRTMILGGSLRKKYYGMWASMVARYVAEYAREGISVSRVTVQNEPMARQTWESCLFTSQEEAEFAARHLRPALDDAGLCNVEILVWDHNKDRIIERVDETLAEPEADKAVGGVAFHWYSGDHFEALAETVRTHPDKEFIFTEGCVEYSRDREASQGRKAEQYAHDMIGNLNAGANGFVDWNVLLDEQGGPNHVGNFCEAPLMYDREQGELIINRSYYYIGHFSRFVERGAHRCLVSRFTDAVECAGFVNPDGARVLVVLNKSDGEQSFTLCEDGNVAEVSLGAHSIMTACWS